MGARAEELPTSPPMQRRQTIEKRKKKKKKKKREEKEKKEKERGGRKKGEGCWSVSKKGFWTEKKRRERKVFWVVF